MATSFVPSRRNFLAATATGSVAAVAATARAASFGNPDEPPQGAINAQGNAASVSDPGPHNPALQNQFPAAFSPPAANVGDLPMFWATFNNSPRRIQNGGWARQVTQYDFAISTEIAGVNMRLTRGGIRELHWHQAAEWAYVTYGSCRITTIDQSGRANVEDVHEGGLWYYSLIRDKIEAVFPSLFHEFNQRIRQPGGFHLTIPPRDRVWNTPTGRANFLVFAGVSEDPPVKNEAMLCLATLRSHDQYNTTIYGLDDRYRGVFGGRMVVFMNAEDMAERGIDPDMQVEIESLVDDGKTRRVGGFKARPYNIPRGSIGAYYPETNPLLPLSHHDPKSKTPAAKSIPVLVRPQSNPMERTA
jgi:anaerobic selenocysteine-containing dehydrogenase